LALTSAMPLFPIVHEDDDLLVINKPADLVCHPTKGDALSSLISRVRTYLGDGSRPQLVNRLDRETSGLVIVAKTPDAALEIRRLWEAGAVVKHYLAIVHGAVAEFEGRIEQPVGPDEGSCVAIKSRVRADGALAVTQFRRQSVFQRGADQFSLLDVQPLTGRKHQIRIHLSHYGHPIVGDKLYGLDERCYLDFVQGSLTEAQRAVLILPNQALHARQLEFVWRGTEVIFRAVPESWFLEFAAGAWTERWNKP